MHRPTIQQEFSSVDMSSNVVKAVDGNSHSIAYSEDTAWSKGFDSANSDFQSNSLDYLSIRGKTASDHNYKVHLPTTCKLNPNKRPESHQVNSWENEQ